jgi:hypothetical protein
MNSGPDPLPPEEGAMVIIAFNQLEWTEDISFGFDQKWRCRVVTCGLVSVGSDGKESPVTTKPDLALEVVGWNGSTTFAFVGVAPGRYRLVSLSADYVIREPPIVLTVPPGPRGRRLVLEYDWPASEVPELIVDVTVTQVAFLGTVSIATKHFGDDDFRQWLDEDVCTIHQHLSRNDGTEVKVSKEDEARIVEELCKKYKKSPWAPWLQARAKELAEVHVS